MMILGENVDNRWKLCLMTTDRNSLTPIQFTLYTVLETNRIFSYVIENVATNKRMLYEKVQDCLYVCRCWKKAASERKTNVDGRRRSNNTWWNSLHAHRRRLDDARPASVGDVFKTKIRQRRRWQRRRQISNTNETKIGRTQHERAGAKHSPWTYPPRTSSPRHFPLWTFPPLSSADRGHFFPALSLSAWTADNMKQNSQTLNIWSRVDFKARMC